jgi:Ca2+-binding RTX toxin-like protein
MAGKVRPRPRNGTVPNADAGRGNNLRADFDTSDDESTDPSFRDGDFFQPDTDDYFEPLQPDGLLQRPNWASAFFTDREAFLNLTVINDAQVDNPDIIFLVIDDSNPSVQFEQETYVLREQSNAESDRGDETIISDDIAPRLANDGKFKSAVVVIEDADSNVVRLSNGNDFRLGGNGIDYIYGQAGNDTIKGGRGNDLLRGEADNDTLKGEDGDDVILGEGDNDWIEGGNDNDYLNGGSGNDRIKGGNGSDVLEGSTGDDILEGGTGNDLYSIDSTKDKIIDSIGTGQETVEASVSWELSAGLDFLLLTGDAAINGTGNDRNNVIKGNDFANELKGKEGNDVLIGGFGDDTLTGGTQSDRFVFGIPANNRENLPDPILREGTDVIKDFKQSEGDKIQITESVFDRISNGDSFLSQFNYEQSTGALSFNGFRFATLQGSPNFNISSDIVLA